jgi:hypothetical protein
MGVRRQSIQLYFTHFNTSTLQHLNTFVRRVAGLSALAGQRTFHLGLKQCYHPYAGEGNTERSMLALRVLLNPIRGSMIVCRVPGISCRVIQIKSLQDFYAVMKGLQLNEINNLRSNRRTKTNPERIQF